MKERLIQILRWTPRMLGVLFALFISIFALDVFGEGYSFWQTILALFMHLLPVFVLLAGLALAWRWPWVGVLIFAGFSLWYLVVFGGNFPWMVYLTVAGPPFLVALLFLCDWFFEPKLQAHI